MPTYTIRHRKTGKITTKTFTISEMEEWEKLHKNWEVMCGTPGIGFTVHRMKPSDAFRDRLREMKKHYPGNKINVP